MLSTFRGINSGEGDFEMTSINNLTSNINLLQPTGFKLVADRRRLSNIAFFCQNVSHPSIMSNEIQQGYRGYINVPHVGESVDYGTLTVNMLVDENMAAYIEVVDWIKLYLENENADDPTDVESHYSDLHLSILNSKNNTTKEIQYIDAFPTDVGELMMEASQDGAQPITVPITFKFTSFTIR